MIATNTNQHAIRRNGAPDQSSSAQSHDNRSQDISKILHAMTKAEAMILPVESFQSSPRDSTPSSSWNKDKKWRKKTEDKRRAAADGTESFHAAASSLNDLPLPFQKSNAERGEDSQVSVEALWDNVKTKPIKDLNAFDSNFQQADHPFSSRKQHFEISMSANSNSNSNASKARGKNGKKKDRSSPKQENDGRNRVNDTHPSDTDTTAPITHTDTILKLAPSTKKNDATLATPIFTIQTTTGGNPSRIEFKSPSPRKSKKKSGRRSNNNKNSKSNSHNNHNNHNSNTNHEDEMWKMANHFVDYSTNAQGAAILASLGQCERNYGYNIPYLNHSMRSDPDSYSPIDPPIEPHYDNAPSNAYYTQGSAAAAAASAYPVYYPPTVEAYYGMMTYPSYEEMYPSYYYYPVPMDGMYCLPPSCEGFDEEGMVHYDGVEKVKLNVDAPSFEPKKIVQ